MPPPPQPIKLPNSYHDLKFAHIRAFHHPATSKTVTPIIVVQLYRPKEYNAFTDEMCTNIEDFYRIVSLDDRVKCVVHTGHGRMFCAGADLNTGLVFSGFETEKEHRDGGGRAALAIHHCTKPVIGAIQGAAVGVGITMCLPMTIRVALSSAKIGFVFSRRGLVSEGASSFFLPRLIGYARALHVVTTASTYRADDKLFDGLFSETCATPEEVLARALAIAEDVARNTSSVSNYLVRELMWRGPDNAEATHLLDSRVLYHVRSSADNAEGVRAFMEKRDAVFKDTMSRNAPAVFPWWTPVLTGNNVRSVEDVEYTAAANEEKAKTKAKAIGAKL